MRSWIRDHPLAFSIIGVVLAVAGTTVLDAVGFGLNVLPLVLLFFLFWFLQRLSRGEIGLTWGHRSDYALAVFYPALVLILVGVIAWVGGAATFSAINWSNTLLNVAGQILFTIVFAIVTEEGISRAPAGRLHTTFHQRSRAEWSRSPWACPRLVLPGEARAQAVG